MPGKAMKTDIEEAIREAEEELSPKWEEQIDQSMGSTGKRNVRVVTVKAVWMEVCGGRCGYLGGSGQCSGIRVQNQTEGNGRMELQDDG